MIASANIIEDTSGEGEVGLYDKVRILMIKQGMEKVVQIVTTVRCDVLKGYISKESPIGSAILGKKVGDVVTVRMSESNTFPVEILSIEKCEDDGSAPIVRY